MMTVMVMGDGVGGSSDDDSDDDHDDDDDGGNTVTMMTMTGTMTMTTTRTTMMLMATRASTAMMTTVIIHCGIEAMATTYVTTQVLQRMSRKNRMTDTLCSSEVTNALDLGQLATQHLQNAAAGLLKCPAAAVAVAFIEGNNRGNNDH